MESLTRAGTLNQIISILEKSGILPFTKIGLGMKCQPLKTDINPKIVIGITEVTPESKAGKGLPLINSNTEPRKTINKPSYLIAGRRIAKIMRKQTCFHGNSFRASK